MEFCPQSGQLFARHYCHGNFFGIDNTLYANASFTGEVYYYEVFGTKKPNREVFGNVLQKDKQTGFKGPDGMKFGLDGRLYCTVYAQRNVTVLDKNGKVVDRLKLDDPCPTNLAFSRDGKKMLVTKVFKEQVEELDAPCAGLEPIILRHHNGLNNGGEHVSR